MKRLIALTLLTACVTAKVMPLVPRENIDPRLQPAVELFESLYEVKVTMPVKVGETMIPKGHKHKASGYCDSTKGIVISTELIEEN